MRLGWHELDDLGQLTQRVLVIHGSADRVLPVAHAEAYANGTTCSQLVVVAGMGHLPTQSEWINLARVTADFLSDTTPDAEVQ